MPSAVNCENVETVALVDTDLARAKSLAKAYGVPNVSDSHRTVSKVADAALVAVPNRFHAPVTLDLLNDGIHVLVEKPMALNLRECDAIISAAEAAGLVLAVGLVRRFYPSSQFVRGGIEQGLIGDITRFDVTEGRVFDWPAASDSFFRKEISGGGVLIDTGVHVLDLLLWWLGDPESLEYYDDAAGGVEADCYLQMRYPNGIVGTVEISRTRNLRNSCILYGTRGTLHVGTDFDSQVSLTLKGREMTLTGQVFRDRAGPSEFLEPYRRQLDNFADAVLNGQEPLVPGHEGRRSLAVIESCYAARRPLLKPWDHE